MFFKFTGMPALKRERKYIGFLMLFVLVVVCVSRIFVFRVYVVFALSVLNAAAAAYNR